MQPTSPGLEKTDSDPHRVCVRDCFTRLEDAATSGEERDACWLTPSLGKDLGTLGFAFLLKEQLLQPSSPPTHGEGSAPPTASPTPHPAASGLPFEVSHPSNQA